MGKLIINIGLPRAGKSHWAESWCKQATKRVVVSGDSVRLALGCRFNSHTEELVWSIEHIMAKALLKEGFDVAICDTNSTWQQIMPWLYIDSEAQFRFIPQTRVENGIPVYAYEIPSEAFSCHLELCKQRAWDTNQGDLLPIIDRIAGNLQKLMVDFPAELEKRRNIARKKEDYITIR